MYPHISLIIGGWGKPFFAFFFNVALNGKSWAKLAKIGKSLKILENDISNNNA